MFGKRTLPRHRQPWYTRWQAVVLAIGALAGAVLSVLGLFDRVAPVDTPDREDFGAITSVVITRQMSLDQFAELIGDKKASLSPVAASGATEGSQATQVVWMAADSATVSPTESVSVANDDGTSTPEDSPGLGTPEELQETATPDEKGTPDDTVSATESESPSETPSPVASSETVSPEPSPSPSPSIETYVLGLQILANKFGLSAEEIAHKFSRALDPVEIRTVHNTRSPMGYLVAINIEVSGLKDVPLGLRWSLDGINVPINWQADKQLEYELTASTDHDSGSVNLWVPNFKKPGTYYVNVELVRTSDGSVISHGEPAVVPEVQSD